MKRTILFIVLLGMTCMGYGQVRLDSIFTTDGMIVATVKEVTPEAVKFTYPGEDVVNSLYKNTVFKIHFSSGRNEVLNDRIPAKEIHGVDDWANVTISNAEGEVKPLVRLGEIYSKATGSTRYSNINNVKLRAFKKMKIEAAMLGGSVVYILNQETVGATRNGPARANISGIAYTSKTPDFENFKKVLSAGNVFDYTERQNLGNNNADVQKQVPLHQKQLTLGDVRIESPFIVVKTNLMNEKTSELYVVYYDAEKIVLMSRHKNTVYNFVLKRKPQPL